MQPGPGGRLPFGAPNEKGQVSNKIELSFFGLNEQGKALSAGWTELDLDDPSDLVVAPRE